MTESHVTGLRELQQFLDQLPAKMEKNIMRSALRAGAKVVLAEARRNVNATPPNFTNLTQYGGYAGALRDALKVVTRSKGGKVTAAVTVGGRSKKGADVYYAQWVEYGTAAHIIKSKSKQSLAFGGRLAEGVLHPGARPKPFLRPALDSQSTLALVAIGEAIKKRLTKAGLEGVGDVEVAAE